jgi:arginyl-tRNA synthetase
MIKQQLIDIVSEAVAACRRDDAFALPDDTPLPAIEIDAPRNPEFGDYATNVALVLARAARKPPREVAQRIVDKLRFEDGAPLRAAEIAGAGFINFRLAPGFLGEALQTIVAQGANFGRSEATAPGSERVLFEFVSANPNGPITVAHGRGGAIGDALATLFAWTGHRVSREFYINDATNSTQMKTFAGSVFARYRQLLGHDAPIPEDGYPGEYLIDIAREILERDGAAYENLPEAEAVPRFQQFATRGMQAQQEEALRAFGITFDTWYSENTLHEARAVESVLETLKRQGHAYEQNGALWLRSTAFGDDKDRVLVRADGSATYIAGDLAYHKDKFERGFDRLVNIWGADHHGYVARTKAGVAALGFDPGRLHVLVYQLVRLLKDGTEVKMGKRAGNIVTLEELLDEVGPDAARFFFLLRSPDSPLDFDLDLARKQEKENPVYYAQYAHARCCSVFEKARAAGVEIVVPDAADLELLTHPDEVALIKKLADFPEEVREAARTFAPHRIPRYTLDLAALFHGYYDLGNRDTALRLVRADAPALTQARLLLARGVRTVLANAFSLMGVSAPERMVREEGEGEGEGPA